MVGAGGIAQAYAQAFEDCSMAELVAVADVRASASSALAERLGCRSYDSYEAMADRSQFDAVIVCTPPATHRDICLFFIKRGLHVLCEKPLSIDVESARLMLDAAQRCGTHLTMATKFRYVEDVVRAKSLVASGVVGEVVLFENAFTSRVNMSSRWNSHPAVSGGGVLMDNGTHSVDLMRYFLGPLAEVQVVEGKRSQGLEVEETVHIFVRSVGGVMGNIDLSWSISKEQENYLSIYGSEGTIKVGWKESKYRKSSDQDWVVFGRGYDKVQAFRSQINNFSRAIRGEEPLLVTPDDALASVEVIEAAYAALRQSQWTTVGQTPGAERDAGAEIIVEAGRIA
ncbi:MAG: Gfo/Idh/MocA family oxidoreductase [Pyrinomonadaceae bacterium]